MAIAIGLLKVLLELGSSKKTGAFVAESGGTRVRLYIENGEIVQAEDGGVAETLGRILLREGAVTQKQYDEALAEMAGRRAKGQPAKLGEVMVSLGILTREQLEDALESQVRKKAVRALGWPKANVTFVECHGGELIVPARHPMAIEPLVLDALRAAPRPDVEQLFAQAKDRYVALRADRGAPGGGAARQEALAMLAAFDASEDETAFAGGLDGTRKTSELLSAGDHVAVLAALLLTDCLDLHAAAQSVSKIQVSSGGPTVRPTPKGPKLRKRAAPTSDSAMKASLAIETPAAPQAPMQRVLAEQAFQAGKRLLRAGDMAKAAEELKRAASLFDAPEYQLWAAFAATRNDPRGEGAHFAELSLLADKTLAEDPECGFAYFVLGHLALITGEKSRALVMFDRARALDKDAADEAAKEALPEVSMAKSAPSLKVEDEAPPPPKPVSVAERLTPTPTSNSGSAALAQEIPAPPPSSSRREVPIAAAQQTVVATPKPKTRTAALAGVAVAVIAVAAFVVVKKSAPGANPAPPEPVRSAAVSATASAPPPALSVNPAPSAIPAITADASVDAAPTEEIDLDAPLPDAGSDATGNTGFLDFAEGATGHRVFMDGKTLGEPVSTEVPCGTHVVRVGGKGRDQKIEVPCGGRTTVPYP